jgi:hypothetical protein
MLGLEQKRAAALASGAQIELDSHALTTLPRRRPRIVALRLSFAILAVAGGLSCVAAPALAEEARPGWAVFGTFYPTDLAPGGHGVLRLYVSNVGDAPADGEALKLVDVLPKGLEAEVSGSCSGMKEVTCELGGSPAAVPDSSEIEIPVRVAGDVVTGPAEADRVSVSGGGALSAGDAKVPVVFGAGPPSAGFAYADEWITNENGTVDTQAGSHPYELSMVFGPNLEEFEGSETISGGEAQALDVNLPPGLVGEPGAVPQCPRELFDAENCPEITEVGEDFVLVEGAPAQFAVYNLVPPPGVAAEFAFDFNGTHVFLDARVRSGGDYGITEHANIPQSKVLQNSIVIWGVPGEHTESEAELSVRPPKPLLTLPTSCGGEAPLFTQEMLGTWQNPEATAPVVSFPWHNNEDVPVAITGCEKLAHFNPSISIAPDTSAADSAAGLTATVNVPQGLNPEGLATSGLKDTTVVLPEGIAINPGQATGLQACQAGKGPGTDDLPPSPSAGETEAWDGPPECQSASKVGEDEISTPLLPHRLKGDVYVLQSNPPELKLLVAASGEGVNLKLLATVHLNAQTGQLVTTFAETPDMPFTEFKLSFSGGAQAALVTPPTCRVYSAQADFTPWSSPFVGDALVEGNFSIDSGPAGAPCAGVGGAPLPFAPTLTAGSTTDQAGGFTDFSLLLQRPDGQQRISSLSFKAPAGLAGMLASVPLCGEAQANAGTCPAASQIGHTVVGAGPGPDPFYIPQTGAPPTPIYLTGPTLLEGPNQTVAPFGLSIVTPVVAGPFNLGTNVVRAKIEVDPHTAQITIATDASGVHSIPTILDGIPTDIRSIDAVIDRPGFMFNPTNCNPREFTGTAQSSEGTTAPLSSHFQMGSCRSLEFKPDFKVSTSAKTSKKNGASLDAKIVYPTGPLGANQATSQANIAAVKVDLPKQLPSRLTTLQKACTAAVFEANPANCPATAVVGRASALTPVLPVPLVGPAYFVSHGGEAFPSLELILQGDGVTIDLVGTTFISKAGITSSTFKQVPDVPVSSFELNLPTGPYSALAANLPTSAKGSFCGQKLAMPTAFTGQNGAVIHESTPIGVIGCPPTRPKAKKKTKKPHGKAHKSSRRNGGRGGR